MKTFNDPDFNGIRGKNPSFSLLFYNFIGRFESEIQHAEKNSRWIFWCGLSNAK